VLNPRPGLGNPMAPVLVVDDDEDIAASIADVLRTRGYLVEVAHDGQSALDVASHGGVTMVLLDWILPGALSGGMLVRRLRELCGENLPIVVVSADPVALTEARNADVTDYLPKPFQIDDLVHVVGHLART